MNEDIKSYREGLSFTFLIDRIRSMKKRILSILLLTITASISHGDNLFVGRWLAYLEPGPEEKILGETYYIGIYVFTEDNAFLLDLDTEQQTGQYLIIGDIIQFLDDAQNPMEFALYEAVTPDKIRLYFPDTKLPSISQYANEFGTNWDLHLKTHLDSLFVLLERQSDENPYVEELSSLESLLKPKDDIDYERSLSILPGQSIANSKVGMVTDSGTIDDNSINEATWKGISLAAEEKDLDIKFLKPSGRTRPDLLWEIGNLYDDGYKFIVCPGFQFETSVYQAQMKYQDAKFVILDGYPHSGDWTPDIRNNAVSIFFAEEQSGFLAGVATAVELKEGKVGFIGGMEIPAVQKFNWGFQQGVIYANENFDTDIEMEAGNFVYQGSFDNVAAGQQLAAQMYDKGVDAIFTVADAVGVGAINEAKSRAKNGEEIWIIGVDQDQYSEGIYEDGKSVVLTSAMKRIDQAAHDMIIAGLEGRFPGGEILTLDATNNGVSIPEENPNLSGSTEKIVEGVFKKIKSGVIVISTRQGYLFP